MNDPNEMKDTTPDNGRNPSVNQDANRPYGDAGNLYEIPRVRPDDPPMRNWWTDDEPQRNSSDSPQNG